ncbi:BseRI endonuclease [Pullulanibacillus camelliae]|uniref:site-specific DNA-methyltransferase (adenine-specific) n=1 Tax=Pullulanibacillus camelliae TaxID=1707096 RepID=A0A8J2VRA5_9BACL|nr:hypothetical protein [Pullulanibacillus camelliae]GGE36074.1 BseRI endonuclease [Pullulanibacillus camelliae]
MELSECNLDEVISFVERAIYLIDFKNAKEDVVRHNFTSYLSRIFHPKPPFWVTQHISGGESLAKFEKDGVERRGFIDNLVGLTVIEYEKDLRVTEIFNEGFDQVKKYCAAKINEGEPKDLVIGILSDSVRWYAYRVSKVNLDKKRIGADDVTLEKIDEIEVQPTKVSAKNLIIFLQTYLGRVGARPLNANSLAEDFGFESPFSQDYVKNITSLVQTAVNSNEEYAKVIAKLWSRVVSLTQSEDQFDIQTYSDELYMVTLGKLLCANIIGQKALLNSSEELISILTGTYFERKGFTNFVEYDYFGWLTNTPYIDGLVEIAKDIQENLRVYDFEHDFKEDLFGEMFAQLSYRTQRILLGQEWTPHWLAEKMVNKLVESLEDRELPQFVDMCCGSGVMIVETVKQSKKRIEELFPTVEIEDKIRKLSNSITGFDIDPLAVILSKISWIIAAKEWISLAEGLKVTIPVYHADSLFAVTPLNKIDDDSDFYEIELADNSIVFPEFILNPENTALFDAIIDKGYKIALNDEKLTMEYATNMSKSIVKREAERLSLSIETEQADKVINFLTSFIEVVNRLHIEGKNGIWSYILKNSYRPGLLSGQFNGLISNPPWLALSKLGNNPYKEVLKSKARNFKINPPGPAFPHIEMATIFLVHGVKKYLTNNAIVACIVPDSVLNGMNHEPFRREGYNHTENPVDLHLSEIWKISKQTFKNEAIVLIGKKGGSSNWELEGDFSKLPAKIVGSNSMEDIILYNNKLGDRTAWDVNKIINTDVVQHAADFQQGADIMPRTFYCFDVTPIRKDLSKVKSITLDSEKSYIISDAGTEKGFRIEECYLENDVIFDVYTSKLVTPYDISNPIKSVLPIRKSIQNTYELIPYDEVTIRNDDLKYVIDKIVERKPGYEGNWERLNERNKLVRQSRLPNNGFYIFVGTSGSYVCGAYESADELDTNKMIVDQTLNWVHVNSEEEALYLTGLLNSDSINSAISIFQPRGQQGARHIHSLPYQVTPKYHPENPLHQEVVSMTRKLLDEYRHYKNRNPEFSNYLHPRNSTLQKRRTTAREHIKALTSYSEYEFVCSKIYNLS